MPPALLAVAAIGAVAATGAGLISGAIVGVGAALTHFATTFVIGSALGFASQSLSSRPQISTGGRSPSSIALQRGITTLVRGSSEPRRAVYGTTAVSGVVIFEASSGSTNEYRHMVIAIAGHQVSSLRGFFFNDDDIGSGWINYDTGEVDSGKYTGLARIQTRIGREKSVLYSDLNSAVSSWTADHRAKGCATVYVRLKWDQDKFPAGLPNIRVLVQGKKVWDPRAPTVPIMSSSPANSGGSVFTTSLPHNIAYYPRIFITNHAGCSPAVEGEFWVTEVVSPTQFKCARDGEENPISLNVGGTGGEFYLLTFSNNAALCQADYFLNRVFGMGGSVREIDVDGLIEDANICDERVPFPAGVTATFTTNSAFDLFASAGKFAGNSGDKVRLTTTGTLPAPLQIGVDYYVANYGYGANFYLHTTPDDAISGLNRILVTSSGTGVHTLTRIDQARYTMNGALFCGAQHVDNMTNLLSASSGMCVASQGKYRFRPSAFTAPVMEITETNLRGPVAIDPVSSRATTFNTVKGQFVSSANKWLPTDFPPVSLADWVESDMGEVIEKALDLPYTNDSIAAQRMATVFIQRARQEIRVTLRCNLSVLRLSVGDTVTVTLASAGWDQKMFKVTAWRFGQDGFGVDLELWEEAEGSYAFDPDRQSVWTDPAVDTTLASPFDPPGAPGTPSVVESLYVTRDGQQAKAQMEASWSASAGPFLDRYRLEYKLEGQATWTVRPDTTQLTDTILDIAPGVYQFRVKAINTLSVSGDYSSTSTVSIQGLGAIPSAPQGLSLASIGGVGILSWQGSTDLDVRFGGAWVIRFSPNSSSWSESTSEGDPIPGANTQAVVPLRAGTYLVKARDSSGLYSATAATVESSGENVFSFGDIVTITEDPDFSGAHDGTIGTEAALRLQGVTLFDDIPDLDAVLSLDAEGGFLASGEYLFASTFDAGESLRIRATAMVESLVVDELDNFDERAGNVDDWEDWDGASSSQADAKVYIRTTTDDPAGSPSWSAWQRLEMGDFLAWGMEFKVALSSANPSYNIKVSGLGIRLQGIV